MLDFSEERLAPPPEGHQQRRQLAFAVTVSIGVHLLFLSVSWQRLSEQQSFSPPNPLSIGLIPANPLRVEPRPLPLENPGVEAGPEILPGPGTEPEAPNLEPAPAPAQEAAIEPPAITVESETRQSESQSGASLPSLITVRESVTALHRSRDGNAWQWDCNRLEESAGVLDCGETNSNENLDYESLERNDTYRALTHIRELSREEQTVGTFVTEAPQLAARLGESELPDGLSDYMMRQMEAGITLYSHQEKRSLQTLHELTANAVEEQAARVLGDPWLVNQQRLNQQRKRHIIPLTREEGIRNSVIRFGLMWLNLQMNEPD